MLTYEKVLEVFSDYLQQDDHYEVVHTNRGYTVLMWDNGLGNWYSCELCSSPKELMEMLLDGKANFDHFAMTKGERDLTVVERNEIERRREALRQKCLQR